MESVRGTLTPNLELRSRVTTHLARFEREESTRGLRPAAVGLVVVGDEQGRACFVLTRRPRTMRRHANQFALPGGRRDAGETHIETALREVEEEVGLVLGPHDVLGLLDDYDTRSGFCITPVVLWAGADAVIVPDAREVASVHRVPLEALLAPDLVHTTRIDESDRPVLSLALLDNLVFAPTAALILQLREVAVLGRSTRVSHYEQPLFAWR